MLTGGLVDSTESKASSHPTMSKKSLLVLPHFPPPQPLGAQSSLLRLPTIPLPRKPEREGRGPTKHSELPIMEWTNHLLLLVVRARSTRSVCNKRTSRRRRASTENLGIRWPTLPRAVLGLVLVSVIMFYSTCAKSHH